MNRVERARRIHRKVMSVSRTDGFDRYVNSGWALCAEGPGWHARIHTTENPPRGSWWPRLTVVRPLGPDEARIESLPNRMGLWLEQGPKVLTVEWFLEEFVLINIRRGAWESDFFKLPRYKGTAGLKPHQLYRPRSRRW